MTTVDAIRQQSMPHGKECEVNTLVASFLDTFVHYVVGLVPPLPVSGDSERVFRSTGRSLLFTNNWRFLTDPFPDDTPATDSPGAPWRSWRDWKRPKKQQLTPTYEH